MGRLQRRPTSGASFPTDFDDVLSFDLLHLRDEFAAEHLPDDLMDGRPRRFIVDRLSHRDELSLRSPASEQHPRFLNDSHPSER